MSIEIPIKYDSKKIEGFGKKVFIIGRIILNILIILGLIYFGYKYYTTRDNLYFILTGAFGASLVFEISELIRRK